MYFGAEGGGLPGPTLYPALHETHTRNKKFAHNRSEISHQKSLFKIG